MLSAAVVAVVAASVAHRSIYILAPMHTELHSQDKLVALRTFVTKEGNLDAINAHLEARRSQVSDSKHSRRWLTVRQMRELHWSEFAAELFQTCCQIDGVFVLKTYCLKICINRFMYGFAAEGKD